MVFVWNLIVSIGSVMLAFCKPAVVKLYQAEISAGALQVSDPAM